MFILSADLDEDDARLSFGRYRDYLQTVRDAFPSSAFALATLDWYFNSKDSRCPHDAHLEAAEIRETGSDERGAPGAVSLTVRLLGPYRDGWIELRYSGLVGYSMRGSNLSRGHRDWRSRGRRNGRQTDLQPLQPRPMATPSPLAGRRVARMNGAGNKILVLDLRDGAALPTPDEARAIHRAPGLDYDQMMTLTPPRTPGTAAYVLIYNNDGSLAGACGNGTRCVADRLARETGADRLMVETARGLIECERLGEAIYRVDMGPPRLDWAEIPTAHALDTVAADIPEAGGFGAAGLVNMGNPHAVFFVADVAGVALESAGPALERNALFPDKANISFAQILSPSRIRLRVWERGVGATLACGSAACATLVAAHRRGLAGREAAIELPGGELTILWRAEDGHVLMTGPVEFEREIELAASIFA